MPPKIHNAKVNILFMLDSGDMMLKLSYLIDNSARTALNTYICRWIAIFDAPIFTVVDRGTILTNKLTADILREFNSQFIPNPTEAPWSIGSNERSHRFLSEAIDQLIATPQLDLGRKYERTLAEVEMAWNFTQHTNRIIPLFSRFGTMPRVLGELSEAPMIQTRTHSNGTSTVRKCDLFRYQKRLTSPSETYIIHNRTRRLVQPSLPRIEKRKSHKNRSPHNLGCM